VSAPLRWGVLGTGNIAGQFAQPMSSAPRCKLAAVGSRTISSAREFAQAHEIPHSFGSYEELIACDDVDAVYISLPNSMHHAWTLAALRAGKHVLCEKPLAANAPEAQEMFDQAERSGLLLMEAFMYRSHPLTHAVQSAIREGVIGQIKLIRTSFCYRTIRVAGNIRFSRELAGGAMMDVGCYCLNFARMIAGAEPINVCAAGKLHDSGVDESAAVVLAFPNGILSTFSCGMSVQADNAASICGTEGFIEIPIPWKPPVEDAIWISGRATPPRQDSPGKAPSDHPRLTHRVSASMPLYALEATDFAASVLDHIPPRVSREDSLGNMRLLDEIRRKIGVKL